MLANTTMMIAEPARAQLHKNLTAYVHAQPPAPGMQTWAAPVGEQAVPEPKKLLVGDPVALLVSRVPPISLSLSLTAPT